MTFIDKEFDDLFASEDEEEEQGMDLVEHEMHPLNLEGDILEMAMYDEDEEALDQSHG